MLSLHISIHKAILEHVEVQRLTQPFKQLTLSTKYDRTSCQSDHDEQEYFCYHFEGIFVKFMLLCEYCFQAI